jgi:trimethylamine--corrinoid protein Co-methyltransferase
MVLDAEMLQMMAEILQPMEVDAGSLALDAQREVPAGGHFFGSAHTLARYEAAFYRPLISDWRNFQAWQEAGSPTATDHAHRVWKTLLERYEPPPMEAAVAEALEDFVRRRKEAIAINGL